MRLAWFTPLPPMGSGIADYSYELVPLVAERAEVDVVCAPAGGLRRLRRPPGTRVISPRAFGSRPDGYDAVLYHLGNNPFHGFVYRTALERPGVAVAQPPAWLQVLGLAAAIGSGFGWRLPVPVDWVGVEWVGGCPPEPAGAGFIRLTGELVDIGFLGNVLGTVVVGGGIT